MAAKAIGAAVAAAGTAVAAIGKQAVESYANYEQLVGGVETLFKGSADAVQKYAAEAYKTAGLSANQYMETVTSFSASLLQSLGGDTEAAAKYADTAITDMSDNANKMGTSMESIQNAYQGFAKQNYTMLDNLKLGYGGTKEEMQRLLDDAEKLSGQKFDLSSYADIVDAIHVVQTEMGITSTTAKEASETISGSVGMMKSSWQNLITGIADDNADFDGLINNFVGSVETAGNNIIPRVETTINGIGTLIEKLAPIIAKKIPVIVTNVLPSILNAASSLVTGFIGGLVDLLPTIVQSGGDLLMSLLQGIIDNAPAIIDGVMAAIEAFIDFVTNNLDKIIEMGFQLLVEFTVGIIKAIPKLVAKIPEIIAAIIRGLKAGIKGIVDVGKNIVTGIWEGIKNMAGWIKEKVTGFFSGVVDSVKGFLGIHSPSKVFASIGDFMMQGLGIGIEKGGKYADKVMKKSISTLTKVVSGATKEVNKSWDKMTSEQKKSLKNTKENFDNTIKSLNKSKDNYVKTMQDINNRQKQFSEGVKSFTGLFDTAKPKTDSERLSGSQMVSAQKSQLARVKKYARLVKKIGSMKIPNSLKQELINMGVDGVDDLQSFVNMSSSELREFTNAYREKSRIADRLAEGQFAGEKKTAQVQYMKSTTKDLDEIKVLLARLVSKDGNVYIDGDKLVGYTDKQLGKKTNNKRIVLTGG